MPGPAPKKKEERRRRNKDGVEVEVVNLDEVFAGERTVPVADEDWHPIAREMYDSFKTSGQAIYMEPSDWMAAYTLCEVLSRWLLPQEIKVGEKDTAEILEGPNGEPVIIEGKEYLFEEKVIAMPGATLTAILKGLGSLLAMEGDRRKLRLELERKAAIDAALAGGGEVIDITRTREEAFRQAAKQV